MTVIGSPLVTSAVDSNIACARLEGPTMLSTQVHTESEGHLQVTGTADFQALGLPEVPQEEQTQEVDQIDQATPDNWVRQHTGKSCRTER